MGRPPCCDKSNVKRGLWTAEEDAKILAYVSNHGIGNWTLVPKKAGLNRCGKSCRLRWTNYLRPDLKHDNFTPQEEELIINLHEAIGSRWSLIAKRLPGRTDNDVKNYWNTKLRKKLMKMGIDPVTHKPVSQVLSDLGSISCLPNSAANQMPFVNKDLTKTSAPAAHYSPEPALNVSTKRNLMVEKQAQDDQVHLWENQFQFQVFNEATSSCSSSSSSSNLTQLSSQLGSPQSYSCHTSDIQAQIAPPCYSSFDWTEFLLSDPFMCTEFQQQDLKGVLSSLSEIQISKNAFGKCNAHDNNGAASEGFFGDVVCEARKGFESTSSSSGNSFVDGILDKDSEMRAAFPELLDGSFDY